ncbi:MAG: FlgD immunoglobulin-like domain containing protein [Candidatus Krumholzibacteriia bacterium]
MRSRHGSRFARLALRSALLAALLLPAAASLAADRVSDGDRQFLRRELRLNTFTASAQERVALASQADGDLLAVWESRRQLDGRYGVFARRVDAWGRADGAELAVNLDRSAQYQQPTVAGAPGKLWMVWTAWGQDGSAHAVVGRVEGGDELLLNQTTAGSQESPVALTLVDGRHLAVWTGPGEEPGTSAIFGRLVSASGQPLSDELVLVSAPGAMDRLPVVAALPDGGFALAWQRQVRGLVEAGGVLLRRFDADGAPRGDESLAAAGGIEPGLAALPDGALALAWMERDGNDWRATLRRVEADGALGRTFRPGAALGGWQSGVALAANADGDLAVAWNQLSPDGEQADVYARRYGAALAPLGEAFRVNAVEEGWQALAAASGASRVLLGDDGRLAVAWEGDSRQGDASAANLTLLLPEARNPVARLAQRSRLAMADLRAHRAEDSDDGGFGAGAALPHEPPSFDADFESVNPDPELYWPGGGNRDEGWTAINNTGWTPPDPHMAVGHDHVMATTNGAVAAFRKDGTLQWQFPIEGASGFWGSLGAGGFVFDPEVIFDPLDQRFMAMACERTNNRSYFLFAVSETNDPTGNWFKYRQDVTALAGSDIDSPNMSVDEQAVYLTADFFTGGDKYLVYILDKSSVLTGGAAVATSVLHTGTQSMGIPVEVTDAPTMYMVHANEALSANTVTFWAVQDPLGTPTLTSTALTVPNWWRPPSARSLGTSAQITTFEARFWSCVYRDGSLWACQHVAPDASRSTAAARWYEFDMHGWPDSGSTPTLVQWGEELPNGTGFATFNSISVNAAGDAAMVYAYSSINDFFSMRRSYRAAGDPAGTMQAPVLVKESTSSYSSTRWGDYSAVGVDPGGYEFWMIHEYAVTSSAWSTWVSHFVADLTAVPGGGPFVSAATAWPNPSPGDTQLRLSLARGAREVAVDIYDATGRRVRRLTRGDLPAGEQVLRWDGRDERGAALASGTYLSRLSVDGHGEPGPKLTLLR